MLRVWIRVLAALVAWLAIGVGIGVVSDFWFIAQCGAFFLSVWVMIGIVLALLPLGDAG